MKLIKIAALSLSSLLCTSVVVAQDKTTKPPAKAEPAPAAAAPAPAATPPAGPLKPAAELDTTYKAYVGNWKCDTTFAPNAMGPGSPELKVKTTIKFAKALDGFWYRGEYEAKKTKDFPGMKGIIFLGHDGKQLLASNVDAMGGMSMGTGMASGDTLTFVEDGHMMGMKVKLRETMQPKGKEISHKFEADMGKGFQLMGEDVCKK